MGDFLTIAQYFKSIEQEASRSLMSAVYSELIRSFQEKNSISKLIYFTQGILKPKFEGLDFGLGEKFVVEAISVAYGFAPDHVEALYKKKGDLGFVAEELCEKRKQKPLFQKELTLSVVYGSFIELSRASGKGSQSLRIKKLAELLGNASPIEARYIARYPTGQMRLGIGDPSMLDAISIVMSGSKELRSEVEEYYNLCSDLGKVAEHYLADSGSKLFMGVDYFSPVRPALAERVSTVAEILEKQPKSSIEFKYDGMRLQIHKKGDSVKIFSRNQENVTNMFPDIVRTLAGFRHDFVAECECLGYNEKDNKYLSFQMTMRRKRKHEIDRTVEEIPLHLFFFDILKLDSQDFIDKPYSERRLTLEMLFENFSQTVTVSRRYEAHSEADIKRLFDKAVSMGLEGIMAKNLDAPYVAGARKFSWIKLKKSYGASIDTIDAVVVGYFLGKGERASKEFGGVLCCVYNEETGMLETIAKSSGFSDAEIESFGELLRASRFAEKPKSVNSLITPDFWVEPKFVVELGYDDITVSEIHTCGMQGGKGYALRFPRVLRIRDDKGLAEVTSTSEVVSMFQKQVQKRV